MEMKFYSNRPPLINVINILEDKGYLVISNKENDKYKAIIFFNDKIFKSGVLEYDTYLDCLYETYMKLYTIYCK